MIDARVVMLLLVLAPAHGLAESASSRAIVYGFGGAFDANRAPGGIHVGGGGEVRFGVVLR